MDSEDLRDYYKTGTTKEASWRVSQLKALRQLIEHNEHQIYTALMQDLGKHQVEAFRDEVLILILLFVCFFLLRFCHFFFCRLVLCLSPSTLLWII